MSGVREWLETIGLAQYTEAFETNNIEADCSDSSTIRR
jgi:hypothetical protein